MNRQTLAQTINIMVAATTTKIKTPPQPNTYIIKKSKINYTK